MDATDNNIIGLIQDVAAGSETAFRKIYDLYKERFFAAAYKMTHSQHTAEEIVQEVFVTLWNKKTLVAEANNPIGYLLTILQNSIYAHFRKLVKENLLKEKLSIRQEEAEQNAIDEFLSGKENQEMLESFVRKLPQQQQIIYRLSKQQGYSREEIAQQLNLSPNTVRNHLAEAMKFIRAHFDKGLPALIWFVIQQYI